MMWRWKDNWVFGGGGLVVEGRGLNVGGKKEDGTGEKRREEIECVKVREGRWNWGEEKGSDGMREGVVDRKMELGRKEGRRWNWEEKGGDGMREGMTDRKR
ncbi:hypothetical protein Pmani_022238 [Petrolisthes manimaculis]|uniref:Uncharacterized protein n=1 Tax=Petrolisthes manimaculis TaxID=1843537 RepID=A0AAE1U4G6_9EUCA|nr:hypothetical protein Pmani_022238 [Petrolisthes manimaculis]